MLFGQLRQLRAGDPDRLVQEFENQQHLHPLETVRQTVDRVQAAIGFCPAAAGRALESLKMDPQRKIGRLRHCELIQLARVIHRLWQQSLDGVASQPF
jgi:hypothetical protein